MSHISDYVTEEVYDQFIRELDRDNVDYVKSIIHNIPNEIIQDYLVCAISSNSIKVLTLFLERGICPNSIDNFGNLPPIQQAARYHYHDIIKILLNYNADIDQRDNKDMTALHWVVYDLIMDTRHHSTDFWGTQKKCRATIQLLLCVGANPLAQNNKGITPKEWADKNCKKDVRDMFSDFGRCTKAVKR